MKAVGLMIGLALLCFGCVSSQNTPLKYTDEVDQKGKTVFEDGSVKISNPEVEYEVVIFDNQFERWFVTRARPRDITAKLFWRVKTDSGSIALMQKPEQVRVDLIIRLTINLRLITGMK